MKRFILIVIFAAAATGAVFYAVRHATTGPQTTVAALLPRETIAFVHVPDLNRTRDQWHETDLYKLYREPAVQDFLKRPLAQMPKREAGSQTLRDLEQLQLKDGFVAVVSIENNNPIMLAGFRFRGSQANAEKVIDKWRGIAAKHDTLDYQQHKIEVAGEGFNLVATVYDGDWFLAANNVDQLKALLDRIDARAAGRAVTLDADENFRAALAHMPSTYAALFYLQPKSFSDKLASLRAQAGSPTTSSQQTLIEQVRSICGAIRFDGGKIRDIWFVGMPKQEQTANLARTAAALGTTDTFLYFAMLLNVERISVLNQSGSTALMAAWLQKVFDVASRNGLTAEDWKTAFDLELGSLADWPADKQWPSLVATLPVKDPVRANKIVNAMTSAIDEDAGWTKIDKNGVHYFVMQTPASLFAVAPTIALSNKLLVAGVDSASVETVMNRLQAGKGGLAQTESYKSAARALTEPTNFFMYVDMPLLYSRVDNSVRPMLLMTAAFMPGVSEYVDVSKLPAAEVVTKHLSPIVSSQRYDRDGYVSESVGPITLTQLGVGIAFPGFFWWNSHHPRH